MIQFAICLVSLFCFANDVQRKENWIKNNNKCANYICKSNIVKTFFPIINYKGTSNDILNKIPWNWIALSIKMGYNIILCSQPVKKKNVPF